MESYLYDLQADPYELTNLIGYESHRRVSEVMWERLNRRMVEAGEEIAVIEPAPSRPAGQRIVTEAEARCEAGDWGGAIDLLTEANRHDRADEIEIALADIRHRSWALLTSGDGPVADPSAVTPTCPLSFAVQR